MNSSLHKLSREKNRLFRAAKNPQSPVTWEQYKSVRNRFNSQLRQTQHQYFARLDNDLRHLRPSSAAWWAKAKRIAKISSPPQLIPPLQSSSGTIADSDGEKAEVLAQFFAKQCSSMDKTEIVSPGEPYPLPENHPSFTFPEIQESTVFRHLCQLPTHKATVVQNGLTNQLLKAIAPAITESLTHFFYLSVKTHAFPSDWKHALVTPIFKNRGDKLNYLQTIGQCPFFPLSARVWITYRAPFFSSISRNTTCCPTISLASVLPSQRRNNLSPLLTNGYLIGTRKRTH